MTADTDINISVTQTTDISESGAIKEGPNWWPEKYAVIENINRSDSSGEFTVYHNHGIQLGTVTIKLDSLARTPTEGDYFEITIEDNTLTSIQFSTALTNKMSRLQNTLSQKEEH